MFISFLVLSIAATCAVAIHQKDIDILSPEDKCIATIQKLIKNRNVSRNLGGIVGIGWDSLTEKATLPVFSQTYHQCRSVPDGDFLIPDNIVVFPIKEANIQKTSEIFESFDKFKSSTGGSFSVSAGGGIPGIGSASGSFSLQTKIGKEHMEKHKQTGFSNKIEYHAFDLIRNEKAGFDEMFTLRLNDIVKALKDKNLLLAQYEAESIIGDYGTHVTNRALAGASISMLGFSETTDITDKKSFSLKMSTQFHSSFLGAVNMGMKAEASYDDQNEEGTKSTQSQTYIITKGGPDVNRLLGSNVENKMTIDSVVGLTREGMPLYSYIHSGILKGGNWSDVMIFAVQDLLYNATQEYFRRNLIPGCTNSSLDTYFHKANVEDFYACNRHFDPSDAYMGGYYQECEYLESSSKIHPKLKHGNQCDKYRHENPLTANYTCPEKGRIHYTISIYITFKDRIYSAKIDGCNATASFLIKKIYCYLLMRVKDCFANYTITDRINVTTYTCTPGAYYQNGEFKFERKMVFGGIFENQNIFSDNKRCTPGFTEYPFFHNLKICLAQDYSTETHELLTKGVKLYGFSKCHPNDCNSVTPYYLTTINNCPYYYCVIIPNGNFVDSLQPSVNRPPYVERDLAMSKTRLNFQHEIENLENGDDNDGEKVLTEDGEEVGTIMKSDL